MSVYYILENDTPKMVDDVIEWAKWLEGNRDKKLVAVTHLSKGVYISTVFLGLDHSYGGPPLLYETLVFGGKHDGDMERYPTKDEAIKGHNQMVTSIHGDE